MRIVLLSAALLGVSLTTLAQTPQPKTDAEITAESQQAEKLYDGSNFVAALPLFEDLHARQPKDLMYEERLAMSLLGASTGMTFDESKVAHARAKSLLLDAQKNGDNSPLLITLLEKMGPGDDSAAPPGPVTPSQADFAAAEKLFGSGDLKGAFPLYQKALAEDPTFYLAALFAGDSLFKSGDCPQAGTYYAKAIAINPDRETAYRYYGDCLTKQREMAKAKDMYIQAVLAQPYQKAPRLALQTWAEANHARIVPPPVSLPNRAERGKDGNIAITIDATKTKDPESPLVLMYSMSSALWQGEKFKKAYPNEKQYRHSLAEEEDSIHGMLQVARETKIPANKLSASTKVLMDIEKDGMLDCYILLDAPDQGIAQDYVAYRKDYRDLMAQYIAKYDIHPM